jgi:hypothetical protein
MRRIKQGNPWENTAIKYSHVLAGFKQFMSDKKVNKKKDVYDNRHLKMKVC